MRWRFVADDRAVANVAARTLVFEGFGGASGGAGWMYKIINVCSYDRTNKTYSWQLVGGAIFGVIWF